MPQKKKKKEEKENSTWDKVPGIFLYFICFPTN